MEFQAADRAYPRHEADRERRQRQPGRGDRLDRGARRVRTGDRCGVDLRHDTQDHRCPCRQEQESVTRSTKPISAVGLTAASGRKMTVRRAGGQPGDAMARLSGVCQGGPVRGDHQLCPVAGGELDEQPPDVRLGRGQARVQSSPYWTGRDHSQWAAHQGELSARYELSTPARPNLRLDRCPEWVVVCYSDFQKASSAYWSE